MASPVLYAGAPGLNLALTHIILCFHFPFFFFFVFFFFFEVLRPASVKSINAAGEICSLFLMLLKRWKR